MKKIIFFVSVLLAAVSPAVVAQSTGGYGAEGQSTLFPYPQAPDTISSFQDRANYVIIRFWNNFDLSKPIQDERAFEGAFRDYLNFFPHAHKTVVVNSIRDLMNKAQSNKANFMLLGRLAEKNLYSAQAVFASDEAYMPFVEMMVNSGLLKKNDKEYYKTQIKKINRNVVGAQCPDVEVNTVDGEKAKLSGLLGDKTTLLYFDDGECPDCVLDRLRLSTNVNINRLVTDGNLKVVCVVPKAYSRALADEVKGWAENWTIVMSESAGEVFDLRVSPCVYIINGEKKIADKNVTVRMLTR